MKKIQRIEPKLHSPMPKDVQTPWGRFKNLIRKWTGHPHFYVYKEEDGAYTALLVVPTKKRRG